MLCGYGQGVCETDPVSEIWVINRGSSSLKLARYDAQTGTCLARSNQAADAPLPVGQPIAIGHRVVHGATRYTDVVRITDQVLADLSDL